MGITDTECANSSTFLMLLIICCIP